jgi:coenzyme Q-binding protein COQ10
LVTIDRISIHAPLDRVFTAARDVVQWPSILSHYRWVRVLERRSDGDIVEMAAWRPFGPVRYPTWWVSHMTVDRSAHEVRYRHIRGITRGMDVVWSMVPSSAGVDVAVVHRWSGPAWPLVGGVVARVVIGPVFIHGIASRTLAGIKRHTEEAA